MEMEIWSEFLVLWRGYAWRFASEDRHQALIASENRQALLAFVCLHYPLKLKQ